MLVSQTEDSLMPKAAKLTVDKKALGNGKLTVVAFDDDVTRRAFAAYFRSPDSRDQPSGESGVREHDGKSYVVLFNVNGTLAVYRIRNDGMLKRLRRWPEALNVD